MQLDFDVRRILAYFIAGKILKKNTRSRYLRKGENESARARIRRLREGRRAIEYFKRNTGGKKGEEEGIFQDASVIGKLNH